MDVTSAYCEPCTKECASAVGGRTCEACGGIFCPTHCQKATRKEKVPAPKSAKEVFPDTDKAEAENTKLDDKFVHTLTHPLTATVGDLLLAAKEMCAGTLKLSGKGDDGQPKFVVLIAIGEEATRLEPEIERLTADDEEGGDKMELDDDEP